MNPFPKSPSPYNRPRLMNSLAPKYHLPVPSNSQDYNWVEKCSPNSSYTTGRDLSNNMPHLSSPLEETQTASSQRFHASSQSNRNFLQLPETSIQNRTKSSPTLNNNNNFLSPYARSQDLKLSHSPSYDGNASSLMSTGRHSGSETDRLRQSSALLSDYDKEQTRFNLPKSQNSPQAFAHPILKSLVSDISSNQQPGRYQSKTHNNYIKQEKKSICYRKGIFVQIDFLKRLLEFFTLEDVLNFKDLCYPFRNSKQHKKVFKKRTEALIIQNLDKREQYLFWNDHVNFKAIRSTYPLAFTQQFVRKCDSIRDITMDLERTFPEYNKFSTVKGRDGLLKVLVAVANTVKEVGYIQGLNLIAGVFLFSLKEEESFWMMLYLMEKLEFKEVLKSNFERVAILNYQLEIYVKNYFPSIAHRFNEEGGSLSYISNQWFITLFSYILNIPMIIKVWNMFFVRGYPFLIQFGLAIFAKYQDDILQLSPEEIGLFLKNKLYELDENEHSIFETALKFKVTRRLLKDLEEYYHQANRPTTLKLVNGYDNKSTWIKGRSSNMKENLDNNLRTPVKNSEARSSVRSKSHEGNQTPPKKKQKDVPIMKMILNKITTNIPQNLKNIFGQEGLPQKSLTSNYLPPPTDRLQRQVSLEKGGFLERRRHSSGLVFLPADKALGESPEMKRKEHLNYVGTTSMSDSLMNMMDRNRILEGRGSFGNLDNRANSYKTASEKLQEVSLESSFINNEGKISRHNRSNSRSSGDFTYASSFHNVKRYSNSLQELFGNEKKVSKQAHSEVLDQVRINQSLDNFPRPYQHSKYLSNLTSQNSEEQTPYFPSSPRLE